MAAGSSSSSGDDVRSSGQVNAHESFRYEWGTWLSSEKLLEITDALGEMRLISGGLDTTIPTTTVTTHDEIEGDSVTTDDGKEKGKRIRIAGGKFWDIILHDLPREA